MSRTLSIRSRIQRGFTLIELLVVDAVIGIHEADAIPKFADASKDANWGIMKASAGAAASASATNYALYKAGNGNYTSTGTACSALAGLISAPAEVTFTGATLTSDGVSHTCTAHHSSLTNPSDTFDFSAYGTP